MRRTARRRWILALAVFACILYFSPLCTTSKGNSNSLSDGTLDQSRQYSMKNQEIKDPNVSYSNVALARTGTIEKVERKRSHQEYVMKQRLPRALIIGTMKSGTTALIQILGLHPKVKIVNQELHFFSHDDNYIRGLEYYRHQMPYSYRDQITIEKSPDYFRSPLAKERIYRFNQSIKLILTVRHPVKRAISHYRHYSERHPVMESFEAYVTDDTNRELDLANTMLNVSLYAENLRKWYEYFPKSQIHIVDGDRLITDPLEEIVDVENFLNLEHSITKDNLKYDQEKGFYCMRKNIHTNFDCLPKDKGGMPKPYVSPEFEQKLNEFFRPYNSEFAKLVGRKFSWSD